MDIGEQLDSMIAHHKLVLKRGVREYKCSICEREIKELCYRVFRNNTRHLCGLCPEHGFTFLPYEKNLNIPVLTERVRSKKISGVRTNPQRLF